MADPASTRPFQPVTPMFAGVAMLSYRVLSDLLSGSGLPPVTLSLVLLQSALYVGVLDVPLAPKPGQGGLGRVCLNAHLVLDRGEALRVATAPFFHVSDIHLFYNMASLLLRGRSLERRFGSLRFALLVSLFIFMSGFTYVGLSSLVTEVLKIPELRQRSAIGFSSVLFALKVLCNHYESRPGQTVNQFGFDLPKTLAVWSELFIIQLLVPQSSFLGHLSGILSGLGFLHALRPLSSLALSSLPRPGTVLSCAALLALHGGRLPKPWRARASFWSSSDSVVCLQGGHLASGEYVRLLSAPLEHQSDEHLAMCLLSLVLKGHQLESKLGFASYVGSLACSALLSGLCYAAVGLTSERLFGDPSIGSHCVLGLSAALFALKVPCVLEAPTIWTPLVLFELFELLILLEPRTRLFHHSGLLVGLLLYACWWRRVLREQSFPGVGVRLGGGGGDHGGGEATTPQRERWTRSWGYAQYRPPPSRAECRDDEALSDSDEGEDATPRPSASSSSPNSASLARASIDSEFDEHAAEGEEEQEVAFVAPTSTAARRGRKERSWTPPPPSPFPEPRVTRASVRRSVQQQQQQRQQGPSTRRSKAL